MGLGKEFYFREYILLASKTGSRLKRVGIKSIKVFFNYKRAIKDGKKHFVRLLLFGKILIFPKVSRFGKIGEIFHKIFS